MKQFAIVVGHTVDSKGACSPHGIPCEYDYNLAVANLLQGVADIYTHKTYAKGYTSMVKETASRINVNNYKAVLYLHYNSAGPVATGCEVLYYDKSTTGKTLATNLSKLISEQMGMKNRGAKYLSNSDRGFGELFYTKAPAVIVEPFFGSNPADVEKFKTPNGINKYANILAEFLKTI